MNNLGKGNQDTRSRIRSFFDYLKSILDKYMEQFPQKEELEKFIENGKNLYNEDGTPTEEYKKWISEVEKYCKENQMEIDPKDEILLGAKNYFAKLKELRESYKNSEDKDKWLETVLDNDAKKQTYENLIDNEVKTILKSSDLFTDVVKK